jgi:hypothetical protein
MSDEPQHDDEFAHEQMLQQVLLRANQRVPAGCIKPKESAGHRRYEGIEPLHAAVPRADRRVSR